LISGRPRERARFRALLIEGDEAYRASITACMSLADCHVRDVATIAMALVALERTQYDVIVWGVPVPAPENRRTSIAELKLRTEAPLVLLAVGFEMAQSDLEAGADQWLPKPFVPGALVGVVRAALRRTASPVVPLAAVFEVRGMRLNGQDRTLLFGAGETAFTHQEWDLLSILVDHPNRYLTVHEILRLGWRAGVYGPEEVRIYVRRLRRKMDPLGLPCELLARHGHGYCLKFAA
jgi:two-component system response regulator CpxR